MPVYICRYCNYKTEKKTKPEKCPYCSRVGAIIEEESVDEILESIED